MTFTEKLDYEAGGVLSLPGPMWGKPRLAARLASFLREIQALESAIFSVVRGLDLDTCGRPILEMLARIVGESTAVADLEELRILVKGRILANRSDGTATYLYQLVALLFPDSVVRILHQQDGVSVLLTDSDGPPDAGAVDLLKDTAEAAVGARFVHQTTGVDHFCLPGTIPGDPDRRFGAGIWSDSRC